MLGILGGTFDPVHNAHLAMARAALAALRLHKVLFIPTGNTHYRRPAVASGEHRVAMLRLALQDEPRFAIDSRELSPHASGYTVDTLRALRAELPGEELCLLMGADQYRSLPTWREPEEVQRLARLAVFARPGISLDKDVHPIPMEPMNVSASEVRARLARRQDVSRLVPPAVANYIERHALYR